MRLFVFVMVLVAVLIASSILVYDQHLKHSRQISAILENLEEKVQEEKWEEADMLVIELEKSWVKAETWWTTFMDHREIEMLGEMIVRIEGLVSVRRKEEALVEIGLACDMAYRVSEKERPEIKNIF